MPEFDQGGDTAPLLVVAAQEKEDLGLEGVTGPVGIEIGKEWVFLEDFEQKFRFERRRQHACQGGLADPDDSLDGNVHGLSRRKKW